MFLEAEGYQNKATWKLADVPIMTKENYVKRYSLEERCYNGAIPRAGVVIDESSGSTGQPNNWVRSASERNDVKRILQLNYEIIFKDNGKVLLNCFALGPWATGMNVSMSLVDVGILKSIGPDRAKLTNTLRLLGPKYDYLIFGYHHRSSDPSLMNAISICLLITSTSSSAGKACQRDCDSIC